MINHNVVDQSAASYSGPAVALQVVVLKIGVLRAYHPAFIESVVRRGLLLKNVGGDANAGAVSRGHPECQIRALEIELVLVLCGALGALILIVRIQHSRKVDG